MHYECEEELIVAVERRIGPEKNRKIEEEEFWKVNIWIEYEEVFLSRDLWVCIFTE